MTTRISEALSSAEERNDSFLFNSIGEVKKFRVTGLQTAEQCGKLWRINFLRAESKAAGLTSRGNKYTKIGTLIHLLAEDFILKTMTGNGVLQDGDEQAIIDALKSEELDDFKSYLNFQAYKVRLMMRLIGAELIAVEKNLVIPNTYVELEGQADLIFRNREGNITILDHKTNRKPVENHKWTSKFQINAYAAAICEQYNVESVRFVIGNVNQTTDNYFPIVGSRKTMDLRVLQALENIEHATEGVHDGCR